MKVSVSVLGRFHAFYLARELDRHDHLDRLITSYPAWAAARWDVPKERVRSLWPVEAAWRVLPAPLRHRGIFNNIYDILATRNVPARSNIVVAWSGSAERTLRRGRQTGASTIVERCSSHIRNQREVLEKEYARHGENPDIPSKRAVEQEEREYALADRIAVPSSFVERTFVDQGIPSEKLLRIPYGVDPEEFEPVWKKDDVFRVVFAGALSVRKGTKYLLEAFASLDLSEAELLLLGKLRKEAEPWLSRCQGQIRHLGHVPGKELHRWYSQGSVFVLPSVEEGMAYVQLQAMACGLPLICTPHTGGEDLIREGREGFVVPIRDVEALKERIAWCYEHRDETRRMGWRARQRVLRRFTWRDYGNRIASSYTKIVGQGS